MGIFYMPGRKIGTISSPCLFQAAITTVEYRIAYVAVCIENSRLGKALLERLGKLPALDPAYIQFGCAEWFWTRQVNSYALQVEPQRFKEKDTCMVEYKEALHLEKIKQSFFIQLKQLIQ